MQSNVTDMFKKDVSYRLSLGPGCYYFTQFIAYLYVKVVDRRNSVEYSLDLLWIKYWTTGLVRTLQFLFENLHRLEAHYTQYYKSYTSNETHYTQYYKSFTFHETHYTQYYKSYR